MTSTPAQVVANRQNALHSTGPRTPEGRAVASRNATKHGLLLRELVLPHESLEDFEALEAGMLADLAPVGELEGFLAAQVVDCAWSRHRLR